MVRILIGFILIALALATPAAAAAAGKRVALVIGNSGYAHIGALDNPATDGRLIDDTLKQLGFKTTLLLDADQLGMKRAIAAFGRTLRQSGSDAVGVFYFAGHGVQASGRNYLIPVEANPQDEADLDLVGVEANWVLRQMESAGNLTNIVILDACRNNPLASSSRSGARGLARLDAPTGSFVAYATAPGEVAVDGDGRNSPFTAALAEAMLEPGLPIEQVFKQVRVKVLRATSGRQTPWDSSSLVQDFYFVDEAAAETSPVELSLWQSVSKSGDPGRIALFLQVFPESKFAPDAKRLLIAAMADETAPTPAPPTAQAALQPGRSTASAPPTPPPSEHDMIAAAQSSGTAADYQAYLDAYPAGVFVDLAQAELAHLSAPPPAAAPAPVAAAPAPVAPAAPAVQASASLGFDAPLTSGSDAVRGRSLHDLARSEPLFPPVAGLPPKYWQGQKCSNCHNWAETSLCDQAKFYVKSGDKALARTQHPFGGDFKQALARWGAAGCK